MPFRDEKTESAQATLVDILDEDMSQEPDKDGRRPPLPLTEKVKALFSDDTTLEFPPGCRFPNDHHYEHARLIQRRIRVLPPVVDGKPKGPSILVPEHCTKEYVANVIERIHKGV